MDLDGRFVLGCFQVVFHYSVEGCFEGGGVGFFVLIFLWKYIQNEIERERETGWNSQKSE